MYSLETILHKNISSARLLDVIKIKTSAWNYPLEAQLRWIEQNISLEDVHCILKKDLVDVAYMNLKNIVLNIDGIEYPTYGIGNVCSSEKGCGYGKELMMQVNALIENENRIGMLFCKDTLVNFYHRYNWSLLSRSLLDINHELNNIHTMLYNAPKISNKIEYTGVLF